MSYCKKKWIEMTVCDCLACEYCLPPSERIDGRMCENEVMDEENADNSEHLSPEMKALLSQKVEELDMSVRLRSVLKAIGIDTVLDLCRRKKTDCLKFRNAGKKSLMALDDFMTAHNLTWGMNV